MDQKIAKESFERTLKFLSNKILSYSIIFVSIGITLAIGIPSNLPKLIHTLLFGLSVGLISLIIFVITFIIFFIFIFLKSYLSCEKHSLTTKQTICIVFGMILSSILLYFIATLPFGLHSVSQKDHYIYVNYLGIPKITKVYDFIGAQNDTLGDYSYFSDIHQAYPFDKGKASVWIFYTNLSGYETLYMPACINTSGEMLFYGYCNPRQEADDSYAKGIFDSHNFMYDKNIPLWKQYDTFFKSI